MRKDLFPEMQLLRFLERFPMDACKQLETNKHHETVELEKERIALNKERIAVAKDSAQGSLVHWTHWISHVIYWSCLDEGEMTIFIVGGKRGRMPIWWFSTQNAKGSTNRQLHHKTVICFTNA